MRKYFLAIAITGCAFAFTIATRGAFQQNVFSFFTCAIAITAYLCGTTPALLATTAAIVCSALGLMAPIGSLKVESRSDVARLAAFVISSLLIIGIVDRLRRTQERLRTTLADLEYIKAARGVWNWAYEVTSDRVMWSSYVDGMEVRQERNLSGWLDLIDGQDRAAVQAALHTALQSGNLQIDYRMRSSDKSTVRLLTRAKMVRNRSGETRLVGISMEPISTPTPFPVRRFSGTGA